MRLGVNIDHVATLREQRHTKYPDPLVAAQCVEAGGADQVTVHLREDRRHIQERDVRRLRETISMLLNLEMAATEEMVNFAIDVKPDIVCLVPEKREELTTEGGLNVVSQIQILGEIVNRLQKNDINVSLFIDPEKKQIEAAKEIGSYAVEIHTGKYAGAKNQNEKNAELLRIIDSADYAASLSMHVHAGHGLEYVNVKPIAKIKSIEELNIGHSIISRAIFTGLEQAVREMVNIIYKARSSVIPSKARDL